MRRAALLLALALAGCGGGVYQWGPAGGGRGLPEVAMASDPAWIVPPGRSRAALAVRTFVPAEGGWAEVTGARCEVRGAPFFHAAVTTPARLILPDLGPDAPALVAVCGTGALEGRDAVPPVYAWPAEGRASAPARAWWGGGWWRGFETTGPMRYPDLAVALR